MRMLFKVQRSNGNSYWVTASSDKAEMQERIDAIPYEEGEDEDDWKIVDYDATADLSELDLDEIAYLCECYENPDEYPGFHHLLLNVHGNFREAIRQSEEGLAQIWESKMSYAIDNCASIVDEMPKGYRRYFNYKQWLYDQECGGTWFVDLADGRCLVVHPG